MILRTSLLLCLFGICNAVELQKQLVTNSTAICVDGSQASYYTRLMGSSSKWVFYVEDGGAYCLGSESTCNQYVAEWPYFTTSDIKYHPTTVNAETIFSDDANVSPWAADNFVYMSYCSLDGWLGQSTDKSFDQYFLRGSTIFKAIINEALTGEDISTLQIVLVGSSSGALGLFNHLDWLVNSVGFSANQMSVVLDSFYMPMSNIAPSKSLMNRLPTVMNNAPQSLTYWTDGYPCALSYDCMRSTNLVPRGLKTLVIASAYDAVVFAYGPTASQDLGSEGDDMMDSIDLAAQYVAFGGATVQSAVSMHYDKSAGNTTVFLAGCIQHTYIMPLDPAHREIRSRWSSGKIRKHLSGSDGKWKNQAILGEVARMKSEAGPFRWAKVNFAGSSVQSGSRRDPAQYPEGSTLGEMVSIWATSNIPDIVGDMCSDSVQCGHHCNNEVVTAKKIPIREQLFYNLKMVTFCLFGAVLVFVTLLVASDGVHSHAHLIPTYSDVADDKELLLEYISHLEAKQSIDRAERQFRRAAREDDNGMEAMMKSKTKRTVMSAARSIMNRQYGKRRIALHAVHSGSNENKKLMQTLPMMDGHTALAWRNVRYLPNSGTSLCFLVQNTCLLNDSWGKFRYGRVAGVMGPYASSKSTLLKVLAGKMSTGIFSGVYQKHILLGCLELVSEKGDAIGFVSKDGLESVTMTMSVEDNLFYRASLLASLRHSDDSIHKHVDSVLERCDLQSKRHVAVELLESGQKKRLAIGMELLSNDSVMFLDEPTLGLDGSEALRIMAILKSVALVQGKCIVLAINQPRGDVFDLLDDLLLMKNGKTLYCGSTAHFTAKILPQLDETMHDGTSDRIISHLTLYDDLYPPEYFNSKVVTSDMIRAQHANIFIPNAHDTKEYNMRDDSLMFERISDMMVQFCNVLKDAMSAAKHATISLEVGEQMMIDARQRAKAQDIVVQVNSILAQNEEGDGSNVGVRVYERNLIYVFRRFISKITINIRRLFQSHTWAYYVVTFLLSVSIYPVIALLLMNGVALNDMFIGMWLIVFYPFLFVTLACAKPMALRYRQFLHELQDDIFGCLSVHTSFVCFYSSIALTIGSIAFFSLFILRPDTGIWEVYDGSMTLAMDMLCFVSLIFLCVVATKGNPDMTFYLVTAILTVCFILSGLIVNIRKFPDYVKFLLRINPMFITVGTFEYLYVDDCDLNYGNSNFCQATLLTIAGYSPYNELGYGMLCIYSWTGLFNLLTMVVFCMQFISTGVFIDRSIDGDMRDVMTSPSKRQMIREDASSGSDNDEEKSPDRNEQKLKQTKFKTALQRVAKLRTGQRESESDSEEYSQDEAYVRSSSRRDRSPRRRTRQKLKTPTSSRKVVATSDEDDIDEELDSKVYIDDGSYDSHGGGGKYSKSPQRSVSARISRDHTGSSRKSRDFDSCEYDMISPDERNNSETEVDSKRPVLRGLDSNSKSSRSLRGRDDEAEVPPDGYCKKDDTAAAEAEPPLDLGTTKPISPSVFFRNDQPQAAEVPHQGATDAHDPHYRYETPVYNTPIYDNIASLPSTARTVQARSHAEEKHSWSETQDQHYGEVEMSAAESRSPYPTPPAVPERPIPAVPVSFQKDPTPPPARHEDALHKEPSSRAVAAAYEFDIDTSEPAAFPRHEGHESAKDVMATVQSGTSAPTPSRAPPPVPRKPPTPPPSLSEDKTFMTSDYELFSVEQSVEDGLGIVLRVAMDFKGNVGSKKDIGLGISDDHKSLNIAVAGTDIEINVPLLRVVDPSTIKTKFNRGACMLNLTASVM